MKKRINKLLCLLASVLLLAWLLLPIPMNGEEGLYNIVSGLIWCSDKTSCLHEIGHALDREAGWVSHDDGFGIAVRVYVEVEFRSGQPSELAHQIVDLPGVFFWNGYANDPQAEIYAMLFEASGGQEENMPEVFQDFYDWDRASELMKLYLKGSQ